MQNERFDINMFFPISMEDLTVFFAQQKYMYSHI